MYENISKLKIKIAKLNTINDSIFIKDIFYTTLNYY